MTLLNSDIILANIVKKELREKIKLNICSEIGSTNTFLKKLSPNHKIEICCAEQQTAGRGRLNRVWHSPYAENIYFSCRYTLPTQNNNISALSLVTGLSVIEALCNYCDTLQIKWPNDIYWQGKKIAGILIESIQADNNFLNVIIGIGININSEFSEKTAQPWTSLYDINKTKYDRNIIIAKLITELDKNIFILINKSFENFQDKWQKYDYLANQDVSVIHINQQITGKCLGVNSIGNLILQLPNGSKQYLNYGEASIKKMP